MAAKDEQEQKAIKQACVITQKIFKDVYRKRLMEIINDDKVCHAFFKLTKIYLKNKS